ncbi:MAG: non-homologous end-joining DNA ligase [Peptococcaceae bacterium]|nr:non-homologous end-joining DNA ligase [Peptococcaceae bacterium]
MAGKTIISRINDTDVRLSNLAKVFWPEQGWCKRDLLAYYQAVAPYLLPHLRNRPFTLVRYPDGINGKFFFQKECPASAPAWVKRYATLGDSGRKIIHYVLCNDLPTLIWLANLGCIELHAWASSTDRIERPDFAVFDLDPEPPAGFADALEVALLIRGVLAEFGLQGFPKTSGASGLHINVPLRPEYSWEQVRSAVQYVATLLVRIYPQRCTVERMVGKRTGKVYIDYLQNGRGKTMACVYSVRPRPGAPVSTPLTWAEVERSPDPADFNLVTLIQRLQAVGDLYAPVLTLPQKLEPILQLV